MAWERRGTRFTRAAPSAKIISYRPQQCARLCLPRVHLVGYSDAGEVALLMAALSPGLVRSVPTWGAAGAVSEPEGRIGSAFRGLWDNPVAGFQDYRDQLAAIYGEPVGRATTRSFADALEAIAAAGGDISRDRADKIACEVLLIYGEHDFFISRALVYDLARRIADCEVIEVEAAGHGVHEDRPDWSPKPWRNGLIGIEVGLPSSA